MNSLIVIPARYASVRFPGKPLALISGKPMIQHVVERCREASGVQRIIVATEDSRILDACRSFGAICELTSPDHASGTERVAEVASRHPDFGLVVNVQGDEPAIEPDTVSAVVTMLRQSHVQIATVATPIRESIEVHDPNVVKVVLSAFGNALYFSRSPIPYVRNDPPRATPLRHLGIYGFHRDTLLEVTKLLHSALEQTESLEQLRWLESGYSIRCAIVSSRSVGVDTPQDLEVLASRLVKQS